MDLSGDWIAQVHRRKPPKRLFLDMDSSVSETSAQHECQQITTRWTRKAQRVIIARLRA